jgi:5-methylthioadenosine/S-adenosylhomocysteine deaminase
MLDILFSNITVITMEDDRPVINNGFVGVKDGKIARVCGEMPREAASRVIDGRKKLIMPGLVNTHAHTAMCVMRGFADDYTLHDWLFEKVFPVEARLTEKAVIAGVKLGFAEMLRSGTTSVTDMYFHQPSAARFAYECGMRVNLSNAVLAHGPEFDFETDRSIRELNELLMSWHGADGGRIRADAAIHGEYTSSPEVWRKVTDIARERSLNIHLHLSETLAEHEDCVKQNGKTPARMFYENGVFDVPVIAAHCTWLTNEDMDLCAEKGVSAAHNPVSNLKLGSGIARICDMQRHGMNVSLGTDSCCSNNSHDLFEEIKTAALLQKGISGDPTVLDAYSALKLATVGGAKAQGRENEIGRVKTGFDADLIMLDLDQPHLYPVYDPLSTVVYSARGSDVCMTMVKGRILYENGEYKTIDLESVYAQVEKYTLPIVRA